MEIFDAFVTAFGSKTEGNSESQQWLAAVCLICAGLRGTRKDAELTATVHRILDEKTKMAQDERKSHLLVSLVAVEIRFWKCFHAISVELADSVVFAERELTKAAGLRGTQPFPERFRTRFLSAMRARFLEVKDDEGALSLWSKSVKQLLSAETIEQSAQMALSVLDLVHENALNDDRRIDSVNAAKRLMVPSYTCFESWVDDLDLVCSTLTDHCGIHLLLNSQAFKKEFPTGVTLTAEFQDYLAKRIHTLAHCLRFLHALCLIDRWALAQGPKLQVWNERLAAIAVTKLLHTNTTETVVGKTNVVIMSFVAALVPHRTAA